MKNRLGNRGRPLRFVLVGVIGTTIDLAIFSICLMLGIGSLLSRSVGYVAGTIWAFFLNRNWVFRSSSGWIKLFPFSLTYLVTGSIAVFIQSLGPSESEPLDIVFLIYLGSVLVSATINYLLLRQIVFRD
jgi:putative flippase GtrA